MYIAKMHILNFWFLNYSFIHNLKSLSECCTKRSKFNINVEIN